MRPYIYHNPRCSKSRQTLELLRQQGIEPEIILYLETPPDADQIAHFLHTLGITARDLMRRKEPIYQQLALDAENITQAQLIDAICQHPILMERPVVVNGERVALGRPPQNVLKIL